MLASPSSSQPRTPEWRHSGPYLLLALAVHGLLLFCPLSRHLTPLDIPAPGPVQVQFKENVSAPQIIAPTPAAQTAKQTPQPAQPPKPTRTAQPVLALAPEQTSNPAASTVPAPPAAEPAPAPAPASSPPSAAPVTVTAPRFNAAYLHNPEPKYPSISRRMGEEGKVLLKVRVTPDGLAAAVSIDRSSGYERLDEAARDVVTRWRFVPAKRGDEAIEATVIVPIVFRLDN